MENFDSYLDEGSSLEKLANLIVITKDLALICDESTDQVKADQVGGLVSLVALRLLQIHKELEKESSDKKGGLDNE